MCTPSDAGKDWGQEEKGQFESINSLALSLLSAPALTSLHDYWKGFEPYKEWNWIERDLILFSGLILMVL